MATRPDVENAIEAIENNGNNTAKEVRDVLTLLLDYTENDAPQSFLTDFEFNNGKKPVKAQNATLFYSFRGFDAFTVNFTFALRVSRKTEAAFQFPIEEGLFSALKEILGVGKMIPFTVPYRRLRDNNTALSDGITSFDQVFVPVTLIVGLTEEKKLFLGMPRVEMEKSDMVHSSVKFHKPEFMDF